MTEQQAMRMALEALEGFIPYLPIEHDKQQCDRYDKAITALRQALANQALDRKAENARELGLDYDPENTLHWHALNYRTAPTQNAQVMFEALEKFVAQKPAAWVGLTDEEIDQGLLRSDYAFQTAQAWRAGVVFAMAQLKEKNT